VLSIPKKEVYQLVHSLTLTEHENSKVAGSIGWTNDPATWSGVMNRNVGGYLMQIGPPTIKT